MGSALPVPMVKGAAFREALLYYERKRGREYLHGLTERLDADDAALLDMDKPALGVLASSWYPARLVNAMLEAAVAGLSAEVQRAWAREANTEASHRLTRGIYGMMFRALGTPERYARHIQRAWLQLHTTGERHIEIVREGEAISTTANWPGHHQVLCLVTMETMATAFRLMKLEDVTVERVACVSAGDDACRARLRWRPR